MSYGPGERWDRERFEREGRRSSVVERDRYEEDDYYSRPGFREERDVREDDVYRRTYAPPAPPPVREKDRIFYEDRETYGAPVPYRPRREDVRYYDERETVVDRGSMVPYREKEREDDREIAIRMRRSSRASRPQFVRRQSSLDTHDRRPMPRYGDRPREEIVIPAPPRRRSPPRYFEKDVEEIRVAEPDYYGDEEYHPYREHEVETIRRRNPPPPSQGREEVVYEEREEIREEFPKRGKTKIPRRLINIRAINELGYPYEEEHETIIILKALGQEHIDEVLRLSKDYNARVSETRITYEVDAPSEPSVHIPPPPLDGPVPPPLPEEEELIERKTKIAKSINPSGKSSKSSKSSKSKSRASSVSESTVIAPSHHSRRSSRHSTHYSHKSSHSRGRSESSYRSKSVRRHRSLSSGTSSRELVLREPRERPYETALIIPAHNHRHRSSIEAEIKALEAEKRALRYERDAEKLRHGGEYILEKDYKEGSVEVRKDRRVSGPNPKLVKAMLATLT